MIERIASYWVRSGDLSLDRGLVPWFVRLAFRWNPYKFLDQIRLERWIFHPDETYRMLHHSQMIKLFHLIGPIDLPKLDFPDDSREQCLASDDCHEFIFKVVCTARGNPAHQMRAILLNPTILWMSGMANLVFNVIMVHKIRYEELNFVSPPRVPRRLKHCILVTPFMRESYLPLIQHELSSYDFIQYSSSVDPICVVANYIDAFGVNKFVCGGFMEYFLRRFNLDVLKMQVRSVDERANFAVVAFMLIRLFDLGLLRLRPEPEVCTQMHQRRIRFLHMMKGLPVELQLKIVTLAWMARPSSDLVLRKVLVQLLLFFAVKKQTLQSQCQITSNKCSWHMKCGMLPKLQSSRVQHRPSKS